jgi:hypothetical protein
MVHQVPNDADLILDDVSGEHCSIACYSREGQRISLRHVSVLASDPSYKILRRSAVPGGEVISAWLGSDQLDHDDGEDPYILARLCTTMTGLLTIS